MLFHSKTKGYAKQSGLMNLIGPLGVTVSTQDVPWPRCAPRGDCSAFEFAWEMAGPKFLGFAMYVMQKLAVLGEQMWMAIPHDCLEILRETEYVFPVALDRGLSGIIMKGPVHVLWFQRLPMICLEYSWML